MNTYKILGETKSNFYILSVGNIITSFPRIKNRIIILYDTVLHNSFHNNWPGFSKLQIKNSHRNCPLCFEYFCKYCHPPQYRFIIFVQDDEWFNATSDDSWKETGIQTKKIITKTSSSLMFILMIDILLRSKHVLTWIW